MTSCPGCSFCRVRESGKCFKRANHAAGRAGSRLHHGAANPDPQRHDDRRDRCGLCRACARAPRCPLRRSRRILQQPRGTICHFNGARKDSGRLVGPGNCGSRRSDELRSRPRGHVSSSRRLYWQHPQAPEPRRLTRAAVDQIRVRHQPSNGANARHRGAAGGSLHRRRGDRMKRREFIALIGGATAWPFSARAQPQPQRTTKLVRIGMLANSLLPPLRKVSQNLKELGYVEGETVRFEYRFAEGHDDRYSILAAELVALPVDLIVTLGTPAALAAKLATRTIPIVMGSVGEAVNTGIVASLARPGGNITGFSALNIELESKRLEVLKDLIPHLARVAMIAHAPNPLLHISPTPLRPAAETLGLSLELFEIRDVSEIASALSKLGQAHPQAALVAADTVLLNNRRQIVDAFAKYNLPAVYPFREYAEAGGLLVHGANLRVLFERAAAYVDRILKAAKPADPPIAQPTVFDIVTNLTM